MAGRVVLLVRKFSGKKGLRELECREYAHGFIEDAPLVDDRVDEWLVSLIRTQDDDRAFGLLYDRYYRRLLAFFLKLGYSRDESRDLIQETFFRVYRSIESFKGTARFSSWLLRIARNVSSNEIRSRRAIKRDVPEVSLEALAETAPGAVEGSMNQGLNNPGLVLDHLISEEQASRVRQAIDGLTPRQRECLRLQVEQELSMREIADVLGIAIGTAKATLHQVRSKLERILREDPTIG